MTKGLPKSETHWVTSDYSQKELTDDNEEDKTVHTSFR